MPTGEPRLREHYPEIEGQPLTNWESEVMSLVAEGLANKQIGRKLGISLRTVKGHLTHVYRKLGVQTRVQALLYLQGGG